MSRIISVFYRLPVTAVDSVQASGSKYSFKRTDGGIITGVEGIKSHVKRITSIGWPGLFIDDSTDRVNMTLSLSKMDCIPVFIDQESELNYLYYCNRTMWPVIHKFVDKCYYREEYWLAFNKVCKMFAEKCAEIIQDGDLVWINGINMMMVSYFLKELVKDKSVKIAFVIGTIFPSSEIFQTLPNSKTLCESLLKCDLVNFHIPKHVFNFVQACNELISSKTFKFQSDQDLVFKLENGHSVTVNALPLGISLKNFEVLLGEEKTNEIYKQLRNTYENKIVLFGVDRLDYMKSFELKFRAYDLFLEKYADDQLRKSAVLIQIAIPCKLYLKEFVDYRDKTLQLVSEINQKYAKYGTKIEFINNPVDFNRLVAYYLLADACLVSSQADGMNLVSHEFVFCQNGKEKPGILILSEFAGASTILDSKFVINPFNMDLFAQKILDVVELGPDERKTIQNKLFKQSCSNDARKWATDFLKSLKLEIDLQILD